MLPLHTLILAGSKHFFYVFIRAFFCGVVRGMFIQPRIGERYAVLMEMPILFAIIWHSSHQIVNYLRHSAGPDCEVSHLDVAFMGSVALVFMLAAEITGTSLTRGWRGISAYIFDRDVIAGTAFFTMLALFAAIPLHVFLAVERAQEAD